MKRAITKSLNKNPPPLITSIIRVAPQPVNIPRAILSLVENLSRGLFFQNEKREKMKRRKNLASSRTVAFLGNEGQPARRISTASCTGKHHEF